jgi:hypothetical protein
MLTHAFMQTIITKTKARVHICRDPFIGPAYTDILLMEPEACEIGDKMILYTRSSCVVQKQLWRGGWGGKGRTTCCPVFAYCLPPPPRPATFLSFEFSGPVVSLHSFPQRLFYIQPPLDHEHKHTSELQRPFLLMHASLYEQSVQYSSPRILLELLCLYID